MISNVSDLLKVSPLEWRGRYDKYDGGKEYYGHGVFGHWYAVERAKAKVWHCMHHVAGEVVHLGYFTSLEEGKSAAQADYEARILAALTPAEPCFSVKEGYRVEAYHHESIVFTYPLTEALTIRSAEEVRREAFEEAARVVKGEGFAGYHDPMRKVTMKQILALINTPAPSTDTTPSVAEAAKVLLISLGDVDNNRSHPVFEVAAKAFSESNKPSPFNEIGDAVVAALRALAAQTGGE